jgi:peptidoglycan/LPS O-acetylase OafA/YrhL
MTNKSFYIPNLNGLRFIAAFAVVFGHTEMTKKDLGFPNFKDLGIDFFNNGGAHLGVVLFFVLSGFLITLLLIKEKRKFNTINYKKFVIRRALRIWPVYFLFISVVIFGVHGLSSLLAEKDNGVSLIAMYYLILPNLAMSGFGSIQFIPHLWSIGVEEQFYLIWPLILKFFKKKGIIAIMVLLVLIIPIIPHACDFIAVRFPDYERACEIVRLFFEYFLINVMAIGGLLALLFDRYLDVLKRIFNKKLLYIIIGSVLLLWFSGVNFGFFNDIIYSFAFGLLILASSVAPPIFIFENKIVSYLGKISYGVYTYHWLIAFFVLTFFRELLIDSNFIFGYVLIVGFTILVSVLSYELFEKKILKLKGKYALIKSGKV